ncbi:MAG: hypothetical protein U0Q15_12455 [Kineosporiaceae bacterium]
MVWPPSPRAASSARRPGATPTPGGARDWPPPSPCAWSQPPGGAPAAARAGAAEASLALAAVAGQAAALVAGALGGAFHLAAVAAVGGALTAACAVQPRRAPVAYLASGLFSIATWSLTARADVDVVEAYSLPAAALLGLAGILVARRVRTPGSWAVLGPAVSVGLGPSALVAVGGDGWIRPVGVLAASAVVLVLGVRLRLAAAVLPATIALVVVGLAQLWPVVTLVPRWITLALVGALFVWWGARYERSRRNLGAAVTWLRGLR